MYKDEEYGYSELVEYPCPRTNMKVNTMICFDRVQRDRCDIYATILSDQD